MNKEFKYWLYVVGAALAIALVMQLFFKYAFISGARAILGLIYVLFLPGYVVVRCFYNEVDWIEKAALSFGLSIALVIISVMFSNMVLKIPITALTNFLVLLAVMLITVLLSKYRNTIKCLNSTLLKKVGVLRKP